MRRTKRFFALGSIAAIAVSIGLAAPAQGLGVGIEQCAGDASYAGISDSTGAKTWKGSSESCGQVGVRARYKTYSSSPTNTTSWKYGAKLVELNPGNIRQGGGHKVTNGGLLFKKFWEFNT